MGERMGARRRDGMGCRAWLAMLLALTMALGGLPALGETGQNSFVFDLSAAATAEASDFAPQATSAGASPEVDAGAEEEAFDDAGEMSEDLFDDDADGGAAEPEDDAGDFSGPAPAEEPEASAEEDADEALDLLEAEDDGDAGDPEDTPDAGAAMEVPEAEPTPAPTKAPVEITITAAGDTTLGGCSRNKTDAKFAGVARSKGPKWFLSGVSRIFKKDDLTILNLEGPLTTSGSRNKKQYYFFKGNPAYVKILTSGSVEICNVANNHSLDYGAAGLKETARVLKKAGIGVSGYNVRYTTTVKGVKVCSLGFTKWDHTPADIKKAVKAARKKCDLLIVSVHWGWEKKTAPDDQQRAMGRAAVDAGADLVIGTHSHVYGGIERYKGKYIIYSLGNFCFGGNPNPTDKRCLIFQQTFSYSRETGISDAGINIIPAKVSSSKKTNDYRPVLMGRAEGLSLLRAVAKVSRGFSPKDTLWTKSNYLVWSGIVSQKKLNALNASVRRKRAKAQKAKAKAAAEAAERYDASALFAEEQGGKAGVSQAGSDTKLEDIFNVNASEEVVPAAESPGADGSETGEADETALLEDFGAEAESAG